MELFIAGAVIGGLAVRIGYNRWWCWMILAFGIAGAAYYFIGMQYLPKNAFILAAICAAVGAILPDLGVALTLFLRRPRTIAILLAWLVVSGIIWFATTTSLPPEMTQQIGRIIGQMIAIAIIVYAIYMMITGPTRRNRRQR